MNESKSHEVTIRHELGDLVPAFLVNRRQEVVALEAAIGTSDLNELRRIAGMMKAVGESFGIPRISELGAEIEEATERGDFDAVAVYASLYRHYLERLRIRVELE
jgi:hypothetical protein